jgi:glyoxylase-like metal-dependent hydrolase (beta-lactamase superfamily II)
MREILPGIHIWSKLSPPHGYDFNGYLIELPDSETGNLVVDPVEPDDAELEAIAETGVGLILLTNRNHGRAANRIRKATGAKVLINPADRAHAEGQGIEVDGALLVGATFGPLEAVDAAGKSPGEVALHWPERRILFVGDSIVGWPAGACKLLPDDKLDDPAQLRASVARLGDLDFDILLPGDGVPILENAKEPVGTMVRSWAA